MVSYIILIPLVATILGNHMVEGNTSSTRSSIAYPYDHPCVASDSMYYEDAKYVYDDIQLGRFSKLYVKFHNCAWSPTEHIQPEYWTGRDSNNGEEEDYNNRNRERQLDDWKYYQCGYNHGEDQWQSDFKPCMNANVAYSLYGVYNSDISTSTKTGCNKHTYINTFFTTDGLYTFLKALQLDISQYSSYYGSMTNVTGYYSDVVDENNNEEEGNNNNNKNRNKRHKNEVTVLGYYEGNVQQEFNEGEYLNLPQHNYYGRDGVDEYGNYSPILDYYDEDEDEDENEDEDEDSRSQSGNSRDNNNSKDRALNNNEGEDDDGEPSQVVPFTSNGGTCRNRLHYGYSLGIGCDASDRTHFTIDLFEGYYCDATQFRQTINSLANLNKAIRQSGGKCMEIYHKNNNPFSSQTADVDYASSLLKHSTACDANQYGYDICPDPYDKKKDCDEMMYWTQRGLYNMKSTKEIQAETNKGILLLVAAVLVLIVTLTSNETLKSIALALFNALAYGINQIRQRFSQMILKKKIPKQKPTQPLSEPESKSIPEVELM